MKKHRLIAFFVLACVLTWWIYPLLKFSPLLGFFGLFGPALAAIIMAAVTEGKSGVKALLTRVVLWRVGLPWYVVALGLPTVLSLSTAGLYFLFGGSELVQIVALSPIELVLFVLVVGEELGWRGYALPLLLEERSPVTASLILGVLWGLWHLPTFLVPGTPQYGLPLTAFVLLTVEYSILITWLFMHTRGSVLLATLFHGAINLSQGVFLGAIEGASRYWALSIVYGAAAVAVAIAMGLSSLRKPATANAPVQSKELLIRE
jgi:membrane protease YdiL (CAAX protease family)